MMPAVTPARFKGWFSKGWSAVCPPCPNHAPALPRQPTKCAGKCAGWVLRLRLRSPSAWPILSPAGVCWTNGGAGSPQPAKKQGLSRPPSPKNYIYVGGFAPGAFPQCARTLPRATTNGCTGPCEGAYFLSHCGPQATHESKHAHALFLSKSALSQTQVM